MMGHFEFFSSWTKLEILLLCFSSMMFFWDYWFDCSYRSIDPDCYSCWESCSSFLWSRSFKISFIMSHYSIFFHFYSFYFLWIKLLNLFFIICSFFLPSKSCTIFDHFFPFSSTEFNSTLSWFTSHLPLVFFGSRWFNHLYRHCLAFLK